MSEQLQARGRVYRSTATLVEALRLGGIDGKVSVEWKQNDAGAAYVKVEVKIGAALLSTDLSGPVGIKVAAEMANALRVLSSVDEVPLEGEGT